MGDFKVNEEWFESVVQFSNEAGGTDTVDLPGGHGTVDAGFFYRTAEQMRGYMDPDDENGTVYGYSWPDNLAPAGWYCYNEPETEEDPQIMFCMNDFPVPYGTGFIIDAADYEGAPQLVFSGEVAKEDKEIPLTLEVYNWTGNCMPVNLTMGDLIKNDDFLESVVQFTALEGGTAKVELPGGYGSVDAGFFYRSAEQMYSYMDPEDENGLVYGYSWPDNLPPSGWYCYNEPETEEDPQVMFCMNDYAIPAGHAFCVDAADYEGEPTITIPSPLVDHSKSAE